MISIPAGLTAWMLAAICTILTVIDAATMAMTSLSYSSITVGAAACDVVALGGTALFFVLLVWKKNAPWIQQRWQKVIVAASCIGISFVAAGLTLANLVLVKIHFDDVFEAIPKPWTRQLPLKFAFWGLSAASQLVFYAIALVPPSPARRHSHALVTAAPRDSVLAESRKNSPQMALRVLAPQNNQEPLPNNDSNTSLQSLQSLRSSLHQVVRPITSRTKLMGRQTGTPRDSRSSLSDTKSIETVSPSDGFDSWDTSSVDPQYQNAFLQASKPGKRTVLETIPGSRPVSPARALDGPFPCEDDPIVEQTELPTPPRLRSDSPPAGSFSNEAHIHPLFRTDSPTPPPATTPGTIIHASAMSGHSISRPVSRARADSRTKSPSPLVPGQQLAAEIGRSPSPPSRQITPPIPDFSPTRRV